MGNNLKQITMTDVLGRAAPGCEVCSQPTSMARFTAIEGKRIGQFAHIRSAKLNGPRHDPQYPMSKLDEPDNLFWACSDCHQIIDRNLDEWTLEKLLSTLKTNREGGAGRVLLTVDGEVVVKAQNSEAVTGVDANGKPTILQPGTKIKVEAEYCKTVTGVKN